MSATGPRFDPAELRGSSGHDPSEAEIAAALGVARALERAASDDIRPTARFADRVMTAIASEPAPRVIVRASTTVRGGVVGVFLASVRDAWRVSTSPGRPTFVRAQAMAFVVLVILATGSLSTVAAIGTAGFLTQHPGPTPAPSVPFGPTTPPSRVPVTAIPAATPKPTRQTAAPTAVPTPGVTQSPVPGQSPEVTPDPTKSAKPSKTARPGGSAKPTAKPTRTPRETETPEPSETPEGSDDHGGGGHGGSGGGGGGESGKAVPPAAEPLGDR